MKKNFAMSIVALNYARAFTSSKLLLQFTATSVITNKGFWIRKALLIIFKSKSSIYFHPTTFWFQRTLTTTSRYHLSPPTTPFSGHRKISSVFNKSTLTHTVLQNHAMPYGKSFIATRVAHTKEKGLCLKTKANKEQELYASSGIHERGPCVPNFTW